MEVDCRFISLNENNLKSNVVKIEEIFLESNTKKQNNKYDLKYNDVKELSFKKKEKDIEKLHLSKDNSKIKNHFVDKKNYLTQSKTFRTCQAKACP